jgi:hypothetical protein
LIPPTHTGNLYDESRRAIVRPAEEHGQIAQK